MKDLSPKIIDETARFWRRRAGKVISQEEARQIIENMTGFFHVLSQWEAAERHSMKSSAEVDAAQSLAMGRSSK
jgi:hypothetical protein